LEVRGVLRGDLERRILPRERPLPLGRRHRRERPYLNRQWENRIQRPTDGRQGGLDPRLVDGHRLPCHGPSTDASVSYPALNWSGFGKRISPLLPRLKMNPSNSVLTDDVRTDRHPNRPRRLQPVRPFQEEPAAVLARQAELRLIGSIASRNLEKREPLRSDGTRVAAKGCDVLRGPIGQQPPQTQQQAGA